MIFFTFYNFFLPRTALSSVQNILWWYKDQGGFEINFKMWQPKTQDQSPDPDPNLFVNAGSVAVYNGCGFANLLPATGKEKRKV
jgi:hypothetical protein